MHTITSYVRALNSTTLTVLATKKISRELFIVKFLMSSSLYVEFHELYWSIICSNAFNIADSDLNVISCSIGQSYVEPWW